MDERPAVAFLGASPRKTTPEMRSEGVEIFIQTRLTMKLIKVSILIVSLLLAGCNQRQSAPAESQAETPTQHATDAEQTVQRSNVYTEGQTQQVSLSQADQSLSMAEAMDRKILRNAELMLEVSDPLAANRQITSIAESLGGFVVSSESRQRPTEKSGKQELQINVVVRVAAVNFALALEQIRAQGSRVIQEKTTGQDVTEEFIDLEARIKTQKALESQFLEIMKQANKVPDALEVQRQVADVRTEIEKLEGRKRFLENRASLSTITVNLQTPSAIVVSTSGFRRNLREAVADSVSVASGIVLFLTRFVIVMVPILILIIIPGLLVTRFALRRAKRIQFSPGAGSSPESN
ncbi:MAG TPA: DUF4349 domain-containing protein [Pyrinomonadaceae bacterium]|nr:DUF4349 domain-containing protein [Pyrinomonadaceae bacterium]